MVLIQPLLKLRMLLFPVLGIFLCFVQSMAQSRQHEVVATIEGDPMYQVLPADAIPAIMEPEFVSGEEAEAQMYDDEMIMGLALNGQARAYSLWQLDHHEIVNDRIGNTAIAVTW